VNPLEKIHHDMKIVELVKGAKRPLRTTFKRAYSVSLPVELADLLSALRSEYNINVSAELLEPIKAKAVKLALALNKKTAETPRKGVDS
jgi:hypothetical protein